MAADCCCGTTVTFTSMGSGSCRSSWAVNSTADTTSNLWLNANDVLTGYNTRVVPGRMSWGGAVETSANSTLNRAQRMAAADERAEQWLLSHLSGAQRDEYEKTGGFTVYSKDRKRVYQLTRTAVFELNKQGTKIRSFCIHSRDGVLPLADEVCIKKILLEHDEAEFLRVANATDLRVAA